MTTQQTTSDAKARAYIDSIVEINQRYGMDGTITAEEYDEAVAAATAAFRPLHRTTTSR